MIQSELVEASELRAGNLLMGPTFSNANAGEYHDGIIAITAYGISLIESGKLKLYKPIPISEALLKKFGWVGKPIDGARVQEYHYFYPHPDKSHRYHRIQSDGSIYIFMGYKDGIEIKYVHQLQNLYFALTGEELKLPTFNKKSETNV